jgi:hypothetical protein
LRNIQAQDGFMNSRHRQPAAQKAFARFSKRADSFLSLDWEMIVNMRDLQAQLQNVIDGDYADKKMLYRAKMLYADISIAVADEMARVGQ